VIAGRLRLLEQSSAFSAVKLLLPCSTCDDA
jgi:hypothetical protein